MPSNSARGGNGRKNTDTGRNDKGGYFDNREAHLPWPNKATSYLVLVFSQSVHDWLICTINCNHAPPPPIPGQGRG